MGKILHDYTKDIEFTLSEKVLFDRNNVHTIRIDDLRKNLRLHESVIEVLKEKILNYTDYPVYIISFDGVENVSYEFLLDFINFYKNHTYMKFFLVGLNANRQYFIKGIV
ncbi:MAG: hypothetical protein ACTTKD_07355 [Peptoanaerobacter stomatis]|uniref:hypothetical protein n=1 Tax=Peptoanaerobacter stomatis TaxID=796937 RepID=UPI003F9FE5DD